MRLRRKAFMGGVEIKGQIVFEPTGSAQTINWTVPGGVTSISMVCVGNGGFESSVTVGGVAVCKALPTAITGDGGGLGGLGGNPAASGDAVRQGAGGGAGGYSGNGGAGVGVNAPSGAGAGGGASGGSCVFVGGQGYFGFGGGGVGLLGEGASGAPATSSGGNGGSGGQTSVSAAGGKYGGGRVVGNGSVGERGGSLAYKNNVAVTPGATVVVKVAPTVGGVRIMWGGSRSYPYNAGDM